MKLDDWRKENNLDYVQLSKILGAPHSKVVTRWCLPSKTSQKIVIPSRKYMNKISEITNGAVMPNDFYLDEI